MGAMRLMDTVVLSSIANVIGRRRREHPKPFLPRTSPTVRAPRDSTSVQRRKPWRIAMGAWELLRNSVGLLFTVLPVAVLRWAAHERGRLHRKPARRQPAAGMQATPVIDWCLAMGAVMGGA
jgi:hypothetical protein